MSKSASLNLVALRAGIQAGPNVRDTQSALEKWVDDKMPPTTINATKFHDDKPANGIQTTRPLCPHPQQARYKGAGDPNDAGSSLRRRPPIHSLTTRKRFSALRHGLRITPKRTRSGRRSCIFVASAFEIHSAVSAQSTVRNKRSGTLSGICRSSIASDSAANLAQTGRMGHVPHRGIDLPGSGLTGAVANCDGPRIRLALRSKSEPSVTPVRTEDVAIGCPRLIQRMCAGFDPRG